MSKVFEDYFSEIQADMVAICLEYVENVAETIYIYCSHEEGMISSDFFYRINNQLKERHKINECGTISYDVSTDRQDMVLEILNDDIEKMINLCKEYDRPMPTEMKLVYEVKNNSLVADYQYELVYSLDDVKTADEISEEWFAEISKKNL